MSCYSYSSGDPIYFNPQNGSWAVEKVYTGAGPYSYAAIARICEVPDADQICVYTRATSTSAETLLTETLDYTFTANETITLVGNPNQGQIVVRRCTLNSKMFVTFTEGAKLSAKQLNTALHQLLFIAQEKEYIGATNNHFYPLSTSVANWAGGVSYSIGNYVLYNNIVYQCIEAHTSVIGTPPPNNKFTAVNFVTNGFIIQGGATLSGPILFDLDGLTNGKTLIWQNDRFEAGIPSLNLDDLADVTITSPSTNSLLRYNGTTWIDVPTFFDVSSAQDMVLPGHIFGDKNKSPNSYTSDVVNYPALLNTDPDLSVLAAFLKDANLNWNIPNVPTVVQILNKLTPVMSPQQSFKTFLNTIKQNLDTFAQNIGNPVKLKFHWQLSADRFNFFQSGTGVQNTEENLQGWKTAFWDDPKELYNINMYTNIETNINKYVLTNSSGTVYTHSAFYAKQQPSGQSATYRSKITGYGIKRNGFYLNIPECYTSSLCNLPILSATGTTDDDHTYYQVSDLSGGVYTGTLKLTSFADWRWDRSLVANRDTYLNGIRQMCFGHGAIHKNTSGTATSLNTTIDTSLNPWYNYYIDLFSRGAKSMLIWADYMGWEDVSYKRLEFDGIGGVPNEAAKPCLFKIPKNIIYYNKHALVQANSGSSLIGTNDADWPQTNPTDNTIVAGSGDLTKAVRFQGPGSIYRKLRLNTDDTVSPYATKTLGYPYKANDYWDAWCSTWAANPNDANGTGLGASFNESDLDWAVAGLSYAPTYPELFMYNLQTGLPLAGNIGNTTNQAAGFYPWPWRPNLFNRAFGNTGGNIPNATPKTGLTLDQALIHNSIGDHLFTIDYNTIFSTASNYIPDPVDEYVFRIVAKNEVSDLFWVNANTNSIPSSIIVEYGFYEKEIETQGIVTKANGINRKNLVYNESKDVWARLDKSKFHVFVQSEHIEQYNGVTQYVINLCIRVPRLKSIGYSRIYRRPIHTVGHIPDNTSDLSFAWFTSSTTLGSNAPDDPDTKCLGPWNLSPSIGSFGNVTLGGDDALNTTLTYSQIANDVSTTTQGSYYPGYLARVPDRIWDDNEDILYSEHGPVGTANWGTMYAYNNTYAAGRSEAAVKFTRLGIPGNLWIKLSVLNTNACLDLLSSTTWNPSA
jgi:hypothetical protein